MNRNHLFLLAVSGLAWLTVSPPAVDAQEVPAEPERPTFIEVAWPGAAMGIGGFLAGAVVGGKTVDCEYDDGFCALHGAFYGAAALGTIGLATGVHLANDRRGSYPLDLLVAAGIWGVSILLIAATDYDDGVTTAGFIALPIVQLLGTVATERSVGDRRDRERGETDPGAPIELGVGTTPEGGVAIAGRARF